MTKKYMRPIAAVLLAAVSLLSAAASCKLESGQLVFLTGDYSAPVLKDFVLTGETAAVMRFSKPVSFSALECTRVEKDGGTFTVTAVPAAHAGQDGGKTDDEAAAYLLTFSEAVPVGLSYLLSGTVKDAGGSSLRFDLDFYGYNERVPAAIFSEIGPEHSTAKDKKKSKAEFAELYILEDGNIGGMVIQSAYDGSFADFVLPAAEVQAGSFVTVHMRVIAEGAVSETGDNLALSSTVYSNPTARDIWNEKGDPAKTRFGKDDVLLLRTRPGGEIADAVLYSRPEKSAWAKPLMSEYAADAFESGIWIEGALPEHAISMPGGNAKIRALSRLNVTELAAAFKNGQSAPFAAKAADWKVLSGKKGGKASPGSANKFTP